MQILFRNIVDNHTIPPLKPRFGHSFFISAVRALIIGPLVFVQKWLLMRSDYNILKAKSLSGEKVIAWSEPFNFASATRIKQVTRSTLNDVFLCVLSGCLRQYMRSHGILHPYDLTATLPICLRTDGQKIFMGNYYSYVDLLMPTNTEGAIPRMWEIKHQMEELKNSADAIVLYGAQWVLCNVLPECLYQRIFKSIWNKSSCVISNMPGPEVKLRFASREVRRFIPLPLAPAHLPLAISVFTYADTVRMCVVADRGVIPDPHLLTKVFNKEVS